MPSQQLDRAGTDTGFFTRLDDVLLGMVDRLGSLRRHFYCPHLQGAYRTPVCDICAPSADAVMPNMVSAHSAGTALQQHLVEGYTGVTENVSAWKLEIALFKMFDELPWTRLLSSVAMLLTIIFFVTSSDSGSLIIDTIAAGGKMDAPKAQRVFWCTIEGLVAIALLLGGGIEILAGGVACKQAFPFAIVLLGMAVCVWIGLRKEAAELR